jgi:hypothetical protein
VEFRQIGAVCSAHSKVDEIKVRRGGVSRPFFSLWRRDLSSLGLAYLPHVAIIVGS